MNRYKRFEPEARPVIAWGDKRRLIIDAFCATRTELASMAYENIELFVARNRKLFLNDVERLLHD